MNGDEDNIKCFVHLILTITIIISEYVYIIRFQYVFCFLNKCTLFSKFSEKAYSLVKNSFKTYLQVIAYSLEAHMFPSRTINRLLDSKTSTWSKHIPFKRLLTGCWFQNTIHSIKHFPLLSDNTFVYWIFRQKQV